MLWLAAAVVWVTLVLSIGCASPSSGAPVASVTPPTPAAPTSRPVEVGSAISAATAGQIATTVATQVRSEISAELTGIEYSRTVDHAMGGGQLVVLLAVIWFSHRREWLRIQRNGVVSK